MNLRTMLSLVVLAGTVAPGAVRGQTRDAPARVVVTAAPLGKFGFGVGVYGSIWRSTIEHLVIRSVQPGGPAERAGLRPGDEILAVDGLTVPGRARAEVSAALRGKDARQVVTFRVAPEKNGGLPRVVRVITAERP